MTHPPRNKHKIAFDRIAEKAFKEVAEYLKSLSTDELKNARRIIESLNQVNCYWYLYNLKPILREAMRSEECGRASDPYRTHIAAATQRLIELTAVQDPSMGTAKQ